MAWSCRRKPSRWAARRTSCRSGSSATTSRIALKLIDVRKDDYPGTDKPRNYSSDVKLVDPGHKLDRKVRIWMNNPLRYAGETIYQSGYHKIGNHEITTLQVVKNTGWMIPYMGCMMVAVGMVAQFGRTLVRFCAPRGRRARIPGKRPPVQHLPVRYLPAASAGLPAAETARRTTAMCSASAPAGRYSHSGGRRDRGRCLAGQHARAQARRRPVRFLRVRQTADHVRGTHQAASTRWRATRCGCSRAGKLTSTPTASAQPAVRWLLDVITQSKASFQAKVFKIDNPEVRNTLGLRTAREAGSTRSTDIQPTNWPNSKSRYGKRHKLDPHELDDLSEENARAR